MTEVQKAVEAVQAIFDIGGKPNWTAVFDYLLNKSGVSRIAFWAEHLVQVGTVSDITEAYQLAAKYIGAELTPDQCNAIQSIPGLREMVHAISDVGIVQSYQKAFLQGSLPEESPVMQSFYMTVKERSRNEVIKQYKDAASKEFNTDGTPRTNEDKQKAVNAFGITEKVMWTGSVCRYMSSGYPVDFYSLV